jgi:hypothetical protein
VLAALHYSKDDTNMGDVVELNARAPMRGTAADLAALNPVPFIGQLVIESDTGYTKHGDGVTNYTGLPYTSIPGAGTVAWGAITGSLSSQSDLASALSGKVPVTRTVNGYALSADVTLTKADVGLSNVDNTSDAAKPISTAQATALAGKEPTITSGTTAQYWRGDKTWQTLDKAAVGLGNVDNTSDASKPVSTAQQAALDLKANLAGPVTFTGTVQVDTLNSTGDVSAIGGAFLGSGLGWIAAPTAAATMYLRPNGKASTTGQVSIAASGLLTAASFSTGDATFTGTVTGITKAMVGLGNVDNTSDANKPVSTAQAAAIAAKENTIAAGTTAQYWRGDKTWQTLDKAAVGLGNVDNTSDASKPVSTAQAAAIAAKENTIAAGTTAQYWRGDKTWQTLNKAAVGLGNVDNTSDASKPVSTAQQAALDLKANLAGPTTFTGTVQADTLNSTGDVTAIGGAFLGNGLGWIGAPTAAATMYLRPNGKASATNQLSYTSAGLLTVTSISTGALTASGAATFTAAGSVDVGGGVDSSTVSWSFKNGASNSIGMLGKAGAGSYNGIVQAGDKAIVGFGATSGAGAIVLTTWSATASGVRVDGSGVSVAGTTFTSAARSDFTTGGIRSSGNSTFASGVGCEVFWTGAASYVLSYNRSTSAYQPMAVIGSSVELRASATAQVKVDSTGIAFYGGTTVAKPTVTGSKGGNAALTSLCAALASLGLITNSTT